MDTKDFCWSALALACVMAIGGPARAQALVVDGEEIADAKLMAMAKLEGRVDVYGTYPADAIAPALEQFKTDTGIALEYVRQPSVRMYERVLSEFAAGTLAADYADLTDLTLIKEWVARGVLAAHKVPSFDKLPPELRHPDGRWYYIARPIYVIGVNTDEVADKDLPKSWQDTFDPKWTGRVGMQAIDAGGSAVTLHSFLRIKVADDAWQRLAGIQPRLHGTIAPVTNDLVRGRLAIAYLDANSLIVQAKAGAPLKMIFPSEGLASFGVFGNVTTTARHPNAAKVFVNYMTSRRGSAEIARTGAYGTHPDAPAPSEPGTAFPPASRVWTISPDQWDTIHETWVREWNAVLLKK